MKPKSALFISAMLTTFVLAVLASLVSAFSGGKTDTATVAATPTQEAAVALVLPTQPEATATQPAQVGPEQAASLAAQYMNKTDVYSVESTTYNGANAYKVIFSSGDIVYIGLDGSLLLTTKLTPVTVSVVTTSVPQRHRGHGGGSTSGGSTGSGHSDEPHDDNGGDD
jgi:hypothetical protein